MSLFDRMLRIGAGAGVILTARIVFDLDAWELVALVTGLTILLWER